MEAFPGLNQRLLFAGILLLSFCSSTTTSSSRHNGFGSSISRFFNNPLLRRLQPLERQRFRVDFSFIFDESTTDDYAVWTDVESFMCQINRFLYANVTPIMENNDCLFLQAVHLSYTYNRDDDTLRLNFFVNGSTTEEGGFVSQSIVDSTWLNVFNGNFDTGEFMQEYGTEAGGLFSSMRTYGFNGSYVPIGDFDITSVDDCQDNPLPPDCSPLEEEEETSGVAGNETVVSGNATTDDSSTSSGVEGDDEETEGGEETDSNATETTEGEATADEDSSGHGRTGLPLWILFTASSLFGWAFSCF